MAHLRHAERAAADRLRPSRVGRHRTEYGGAGTRDPRPVQVVKGPVFGPSPGAGRGAQHRVVACGTCPAGAGDSVTTRHRTMSVGWFRGNRVDGARRHAGSTVEGRAQARRRRSAGCSSTGRLAVVAGGACLAPRRVRGGRARRLTGERGGRQPASARSSFSATATQSRSARSEAVHSLGYFACHVASSPPRQSS